MRRNCDNCGHQNEEICNTCPDLCCGIYPVSKGYTTCNGKIDARGYCDACHQPAPTSSGVCGRFIEIIQSSDSVVSPPAEKVERFEKVEGWISVKDGLPERNQNVLIAREKPFHTYLLTAFQRDGVFHSNQDAIMLGKVTHWMPLPKPPVK